MNKITKPLTFTVPLSFEAHSLAQSQCRGQFHPSKAKQVYLNLLAVYAVDYYLQCLGLETDGKGSDSHNPICVKFMNVADLLVKQHGKLECRPVLPEAQVCQIPPEVRSERIGYLAVRMDQSLKQATLLGFTPTAAVEVPLDELRSLGEFPEYLSQFRQTQSSRALVMNLRKWLDGAIESSWQTLEQVLDPYQKKLAPVREIVQEHAAIKRAKLLDLGIQLGERTVVLVITVIQEEHQTVRVGVQIYPSNGQTYLPPNLSLIMLSERGETLQQVNSRNEDNYIQLRRFSGKAGDRFRLSVTLDHVSVTEDFIL